MVSTTRTNKPILPRGNDASPLGYNRAALYSGKALDFDGVNDQISIGSANFLGLGTGSFSFAWYINSTESADFKCIIDYRHTSGIGILLDHRLGGIGGALQTAEGNFAFDITSATSSVSGDVFDGKWHHVVFVADRSTSNTRVTFYIDGQLHYYDVNTNTQTSTIEDGQQMYFGSQDSTQYVDASLSSLKVFSTALTAAQVADLYNNPEKVVPTGVDNTALKLWLPMMEGAGTTAYDGSGNGNHGTISGATYVNGVGAPVSQTAVIDWNKGTNVIPYSEQFDQWSTFTGSSVSANTTTAPDGQTTADTLNFGSGSESLVFQNYGSGSATFTSSIWAKSSTGKKFTFRHWNGTTAIRSDEFTTTSEWQRFDFTFTDPLVNVGVSNEDNGSTGSIEIWGFQLEQASSVGPYVRTGATAQTSPVLLPQGLTSGRDITGVNLFENVRKQGALNLDGNSWAEVHKNDSIPEGDEGRTLECWFFGVDRTHTQSYMETGNNSGTNKRFAILTIPSNVIYIAGQIYDINTGTLADLNAWNHVVVTHDGSTAKVYKNGSLINTSSRTYTTALDTVSIGRNLNNAIETSNGSIAQPRIYKRALTAEEVQRSYDSGKNIFTNS